MKRIHRQTFFINLFILTLIFPALHSHSKTSAQDTISLPAWEHRSTTSDDLAVPSDSTEQTATLVFDVNRDGRNDFVIGVRNEPGPALVWFQQTASGWVHHVIETEVLPIEAGGTFHDIDGDGDQDIVMGADWRSNEVWWWENPYPTYAADIDWTRRIIKNSGDDKHHDQMFADVDADGAKELVFWNQEAKALVIAEIPASPKATEPWPQQVIYTWTGETEHEGLSHSDVDGDGILDIVGGGRWFKRRSNGTYQAIVIDNSKRYSRSAVGQLKAGGRPEIVFVCGDCDGPMHWYEWNGSQWVAHKLLDVDVEHGHSLEIADINRDGFLDIFNAEMRLDGSNDDAANRIFYGDGKGNFVLDVVSTGIGNHESTLDDLDNDGDLDILGKPFNWDTPRLDIWLNQSNSECTPALDNWRRHVIDSARPWGALFITAGDMDGDNDADVITGGWWYENPGTSSAGWTRHTIGSPLNNMATVGDLDGDGDLDVIGTGGKQAQSNAEFVWAENDGAGNFAIHDNIAETTGNFLQGVAMAHFQPSNALQLAFSWHDESQGVRMLTVPADPINQTWQWRQISSVSQGEALTSHDLDRDGNLDLLLGTVWLRNASSADSEAWQEYTINPDGEVDRNHVVDMNGDNRPDAVVGFEAVNVAGKLVWYEQPQDPTTLWTEHEIATPVGPMSVDVQDLDGDGDWDVIAGEHNLRNPETAALWVYENLDGVGGAWAEHLVYRGDEHHDGAQSVDVDGDGDFDIVSIGWGHGRVLLYESLFADCGGLVTPIPTTMLTPSATVTPTPIDTITVTGTPSVTPSATVTGTTTPIPPATQTPDVSGTESQQIYLPLLMR